MRFDKVEPNEVEITVSQRNIRTLLSKAQDPDSNKEIISEGADGFPRVLKVNVESDAVHYAGRPLPPGIVRPEDDPDRWDRAQEVVDDLLSTLIEISEHYPDAKHSADEALRRHQDIAGWGDPRSPIIVVPIRLEKAKELQVLLKEHILEAPELIKFKDELERDIRIHQASQN